MSLTASPPAKTLRRRLFGSHLLVIGVALVVVVVGIGIVFGLFELIGGRGDLGRGQDSGPFGLLFGVAAAALASAAVSWRVSRKLAQPLEAIGVATQELAAGRYDVRLPNADTVELDELAGAVNQLAVELGTTEQRRLRLIGDVAHELRNPLSTIEGTMEALLDGVMEPEPDTFARIGRESARLRRLADDLSALSTAGEMAGAGSEPVDVSTVAAGVVAQLDVQARAKGIDLELVDSGATTAVGDRDRLTQVLMNVIGNAVQYTDSGKVVVTLSTVDRRVHVEVADSGRGLAPSDLTNVFERFYRVDQHFSDGTGVGLAIAKLIVEAHDGTISAQSNDLGQGSTFTIELPAS